ncbi:MAG: SBBP repeat-containing protein [Phaeodactylibacter sp.]|nr:SBBP repeat-containing protein [Phaeodactylibacter sp.]MCB9294513.1 SBBP repeat-containing protein [Lewinellaceae bacterium]
MRTPFTLMLFSLAFLLSGIPLSALLPGNPGHQANPQITVAGIPAAPEACAAEQMLNGGPALAWATYYGGLDGDFGRAIAADSMGNVYLAGDTESEDIMNTGGHQNTYGGGDRDVFLVKSDASGARLWSTYYGGTGWDYGYSLAIDQEGNLYLAGTTNSSGNIASGGHQNTHGGSNDAFLVKFDAAGVRQWATYYGGSGSDSGTGVAVDKQGNVYLAGHTQSTAGIASGGHQNTHGGTNDAFLAKFNASGTRLWATYYGGFGFEENSSVATDGEGNVFLSGRAEGFGNIASGGHQNNFGGGTFDAFLAKFNAAGVRQWATFYGGSRDDLGFSVATDGSGNVYLAGITGSENNIAAAGHQMSYGGVGDAFLAKFNAAGARQWGTYYGGTSGEQSGQVAVDAEGNVYLAGTTVSTDNIAFGGFQDALRGSTDLFLARFDSAGARQWGTYYGAVPDDQALAVAAGPSGDIYVSGYTESFSNFATGGFQNTYGGGAWDAFLVKVEGGAISGSPALTPLAPQINTYPNPVKDVLQVVVANPSLSACTLQLHSVEGRLLREQEIPAPGSEWTAELGMQGLSAGIYVLTVRSAAGSAGRKVIKE